MKASQVAIVVVAAVAVGLVVLLGRDDGGDDGGSAQSRAPAGSLAVPFAYSPEKEKLLAPLIRRFNRSDATAGGKPVFVEGQVVSSGRPKTTSRTAA